MSVTANKITLHTAGSLFHDEINKGLAICYDNIRIFLHRKQYTDRYKA
jgi:hypothetical protein